MVRPLLQLVCERHPTQKRSALVRALLQVCPEASPSSGHGPPQAETASV